MLSGWIEAAEAPQVTFLADILLHNREICTGTPRLRARKEKR